MAQIVRLLEPDDLNAVTAWLSAQALPANPKALARLPAAPSLVCGSVSLPATTVAKP